MSPEKKKGRPRRASDSPSEKENRPRPDPLALTTHRDLLTRQQEIFARLTADQEAATMLFINPVLAFEAVGVTLAPELAHHVLHSIRHPPTVRAWREAAEAKLTEALGEPPRPEDPEWLADVLFKKLKLVPLETKGKEPLYRPSFDPETLARLAHIRPTLRTGAAKVRGVRGTRLSIKAPPPSVRRIDLEATVQDLPRAPSPPGRVSLEELFFYKDAHPLAKLLLELGIIRRRGFVIHTPDTFRRIRDGSRPNAFRGWIRSIRFRPKPPR